MQRQVTVVIGAGGMGLAIARRVGAGTHLVLADFDGKVLDSAAGLLGGEGHEATAQRTDVTSRASVAELARLAASLGEVKAVVHTAGLSPVQAPVPAILAVDLLGVALVLEEFGEVVAAGGAGLVIASMAGHLYPAPSAADLRLLGTTPADELLALPITAAAAFPDSGAAYGFAKRANVARVQAASTSWGRRGARVNAISPGVIATPMGREELSGEHGASMRALVGASNARRVGTPADIAEAAAFLLGPASSFISGTDLLVDGGTTAAVASGALG